MSMQVRDSAAQPEPQNVRLGATGADAQVSGAVNAFEADAKPAGAEPQQAGPYTLLRPLDPAGPGAWFEAHDRVHDRRVMVCVPALHADPAAREPHDTNMLSTLGQATALRHPYLAAVLDVQAGATGPYLVTEWPGGRSLANALQAGWQTPPSLAALLMHRVALGLAHAHAAGVCHGGVDPSCIWLVDDHTPKLLAFGVATTAQATGLPELDPFVNGPGHFLAPEQLTGAHPDARTDVHGIGVVLYTLLTGHQAYPGHTAAQVAQSLLKHAPLAPHMVQGDLPVDLSDIVMRALQRDPAHRYADAAALAEALGQWLKGQPAAVPGAPVDVDANTPAWAVQSAPTSRNRTGWMVASGVLVAGAVLAAGWRLMVN
jgi:hypothetical protein